MSRTINRVDPTLTRADVAAAVVELSSDGVPVTRKAWDKNKPDGQPTSWQIEKRWNLTWGKFLKSVGLEAKSGPRSAHTFITDVDYYVNRMRALCPRGMYGLRRADWDAARVAKDGELSSAAIARRCGGWTRFLEMCGLRNPPPINAGRRPASEEDEAAIFAEMIAEATNNGATEKAARAAQPLRLVASGTPRRVERRYCPASRSYYTVQVYGGGRFE